MPKEVSAGAIIFRKEINKNLYLLLHYPSGHWEFAKGHIEKGENELTTVRREVKEETGLKDLRIIPGFREYRKYSFRAKYPSTLRNNSGQAGSGRAKAPWVFKIVFFYLAQTWTKEVKISHEHQGFKWLPYEEAIKRLTFKNAKEMLKKANSLVLKVNSKI